MQDNSFTLIRDIKEINLKRGCVAAIGNFDGLHQGHQDIISSVTALAALHKLIPTIITFEPMPISYLKPSTPVCRLMSLSEKLFWLRKWGIEQVICLRFNQALSQLSPQAFVETILIKKLNMKHLIVGENFRFGYQQSGDILQLEALAKKYPFTLHSKPLLNVKNERLSSTALREALLAGNCEKARLILGRPYCISRRVVRGDQRGKQWGFPTANLILPRNRQWLKGVYLTRIEVEGERYWAVTNCGTRPTVGGVRHVVESHLDDFSGELYGKRITVEFLHKLRDEKRFDNVEALKAQIEQDKIEAKKLWITKIH